MSILRLDRTGNRVKAVNINDLPEEAWTQLTGVSANDQKRLTLYSQVAWLYAVQQVRAEAVASMPIEFQTLAGEALEEPELPFDLHLPDMLRRGSMALDLFGFAYWEKMYSAGARVVSRVRWLKPTSIKPRFNAAQGLYAFERDLSSQRVILPVEDERQQQLIWTWLPGIEELGPGTPPAAVSMAASAIIQHQNQVTNNFFERGAIDHWLLFGRQVGMKRSDQNRFRDWWFKLLRGGIQRMGELFILDPESKVERLNSPISEWVIPELQEISADDICLAHNTPREIVQSRLSSNKSTLDRATQTWFNRAIAPRATLLVNSFNTHLMEDYGIRLEVVPQRLEINQEDEVARSAAYRTLYESNMPPETIVRMLGMETYGMPLEREELLPSGQRQDDSDNPFALMKARRAEELRRLRAFAKSGKYLRRPFESDILTPTEIAETIKEVAAGQDAPFRLDWQGYP